jgi:predicted transglutaminase-like cysteine proteinase
LFADAPKPAGLQVSAFPKAALAALGAIFLQSVAIEAKATTLDQVFSDQFYASSDLSRVPLWRDLLSRMSDDGGDWRTATDAFFGTSPEQQLNQVNALFNKPSYHTDQASWGVQDYWETPSQLLAFGGDCEDSAAAKYFALRQLGFPASALRITLVRDVRAGQFHAVLLVALAGRVMLLDNHGDVVRNADGLENYVPILAMNEDMWWRV